MLHYGKFGKMGKSPLGLLLAGAAAFAYYKYNKMTPEQRKDFVGNLKEKGRKLFGQFMPGSKKQTSGSDTANGYNFSEGSQYTG